MERLPDGLTQVTEMVWPGRYFDTVLVRLCGAPTTWPFTAVITDPAVIPTAAAGPPQMVPRTSVPLLTLAMVSGVVWAIGPTFFG